jgi:hypothetical protein
LQNEYRVLRALRSRIRDPAWLRDVRVPTRLEDAYGRDAVCVTDVGELSVQVKSSEHYAKKFLQSYLRGDRGTELTVVIVTSEEEADEPLAQRIVDELEKLRAHVQRVGRPLAESWRQYGNALREALDDPRATIDVDRAKELVDVWARLGTRPCWAVSLELLPTGLDIPPGALRLVTEFKHHLIILPLREPEGSFLVQQAVGTRSFFGASFVPVHVPEDAKVETWLTEQLYGYWERRYQDLRRRP